MLSKHIDVIALLALGFGLLVFSRPPQARFVQEARVARVRVYNALTRSSALTRANVLTRTAPCPLTEALLPHFR